MTDLRARLADALRPNIGIQCVCGRPARECHQRAEHIADVLLSLPAIAIVDRQSLVDIHDFATAIHDEIEKMWAAANAAEAVTK